MPFMTTQDKTQLETDARTILTTMAKSREEGGVGSTQYLDYVKDLDAILSVLVSMKTLGEGVTQA